ncbi:nicotinate-nucleotide--dimethylbenzimidazole phosphoribosyltransferase [Alkalihalobacillus sp. BA299]|uniref:nicotinate-nucleotide--dimethylbenzimidazole phosphoribosyltransferase n=1 Tax=Alkalihalobacillus sp. BA299 TaxID=2815938 RepID=UPI001ADA7DE1|nr:nicotinate-nucleotide--dimethylbenzimidazole phosphoribosyltransferase [Alkalihalobacillus sp. BA299]
MKKIDKILSQIMPLDAQVMQSVSEHVDQLTKPIGALGRIEELAIQLAGITRKERPTVKSPAVIVCAGDHGIVSEGVSAYPQEVTKLMIHNFIEGRAAINVLANQIGASVTVVDVGVNGEVNDPSLVMKKVKKGTNNFYTEDAMSEHEALQAIEAGMDVAKNVIDNGHEVIIIGEMGIGNTTASSALIAAYTNANVQEVVGRGTGLNDEEQQHKIAIIEEALKRRNINGASTLQVLARVGGLEIAALTGVLLQAAADRTPVIVDGFISTAAALVAYELSPTIKDYLIISHQSVEPGHKTVFEYLNKKPLLSLDLRLGEGTGAALAYPLLDAATRILTEMATFADLGIEKKELPSESTL